MQTHTSYNLSKALKEFCPELPEPTEENPLAYYGKDLMHYVPAEKGTEMHRQMFNGFAYRLEDLLSELFCEKMIKAGVKDEFGAHGIMRDLGEAYWQGGMPAVERELWDMMEKEEA